MKRNIVLFMAILMMLVPLVRADTTVSSCADLNVTGETYLLNQSIIDSSFSICFDITANNITLDCQGYSIDGDGVGEIVGVNSAGNDYVNIYNCLISDWYDGIRVEGNDIRIINLSLDNMSYKGVEGIKANNLLILNVNADNMNTENEPIEIRNSTNITVDCQNGLINGTADAGIEFMYDVTDSIIENCVIDGFERDIWVHQDSDNSIVRNNTLFSRKYGENTPLRLEHSRNILAEHNKVFGGAFGTWTCCDELVDSVYRYNEFYDCYIGMGLAQNNTNITVYNNTIERSNYGIFVLDSDNHTIFNNTVRDMNVSLPRDCMFVRGNGLTVYDNYFGDCQRYSIQISSNGSHFYNNYFDGGVLVDGSNDWNTTRQAGTRVFGYGDEIGGNYWTTSTKDGYSNSCGDSDGDWFCDNPYALGDGFDYLAYGGGYCGDGFCNEDIGEDTAGCSADCWSGISRNVAGLIPVMLALGTLVFTAKRVNDGASLKEILKILSIALVFIAVAGALVSML